MINYCPQCGIKIDKDYKFCPNCGKNFSAAERQTSKPAVPVVICKNCGEENPADTYECISCGIPLQKGKPEKTRIRELQKNRGVQNAGKEKSLDLTKLIAIFAGVIGIALIILIASGAFDSPLPDQRTELPVENSGTNSGVNLAALQQINELEKRVQAEPANIELLLELAHLRNDNGFFQKAIEDYKQYLEKNPSNADARIDMGVCYYNLKEYDTAIAEMKKALEYKPGHQIGHLNLGIVNLAAGRLDESRTWLEKAVEINPDNDIGLRAKELLKNH
jgi:tetratricopeptide (TPR) repeat protein